ncbi:MAG: HEAT repeat domain-containing protein [Candidatus Melainabacteria bacterium]|nr:HEAT repeat domain-containing protein [Candidatus Melainabacteria bacterium]
MEMSIFFKSFWRYLVESPEHIREELVKELRERMHRKDDDSPNRLSLATEETTEYSHTLAKLIVRDPDAPASVLSRLACTGNAEILERVAEHTRTSPFTLAELSRSEHAHVRMAVAENANTPEPVLSQLARDEHPDVRYRLAENPNVYVTILVQLEEDDNPYVRMRASQTLRRLDFGYQTATAA